MKGFSEKSFWIAEAEILEKRKGLPQAKIYGISCNIDACTANCCRMRQHGQ